MSNETKKAKGRPDSGKNRFKFLASVLIWGGNTGIWAYVWMTEYAEEILRPFGYKGNWLVIAVYAILLFLFTQFYGGYRIGYYRRTDMVFSGLWGMLFSNAITYLQTCLVGRAIMDARPFVAMTLLQGFLITLWALGVNTLYHRTFPPRKMLLIYGGRDQANSLLAKMVTRSEKYLIQQAVSAEGKTLEELSAQVEGYEAAVLCDLPAKLRNGLLKYCFAHAIRTYTTPKISDILIRGSEDITLFDSPLLLNRNGEMKMSQRFLKRTLDLTLGVIMLMAASPFMLLAAAAIKLCDGGPILYRQTRLTIGGREFTVNKFRSMEIDAEKKSGIILSTVDDTRVTPVGRLMRLTRFDELPQLFNILKGDMSFVGPRPERPELAAEYRKSMPEFDFRLKVKAGLTGYAQIIGQYNTTPYDKLKMDLMYIARYSIMEDLKLILMTPKVLFNKQSTAGVDPQQRASKIIDELTTTEREEKQC